MRLELFPMSYSKAKSVELCKSNLKKCPDQKCNTKAAFKGQVMEFRTIDDDRPGSLDEYHTVLGCDEAILHFTDGEVHVRLVKGKWIA
jgi:hypothetical protein